MTIGEGWDVPPAAAPWSDFHWFRVSPRSSLVVVVLSDQVLWYTGHFMDGRMCPCLGKECEVCKEGISGQVRYVVPVAEISAHRVGLLEVGQSVGQLIRSWEDRHGGLRGMVLEFRKHSHARQSRTEVEYIEEQQGPWYRNLQVPDVKRALVMTWKKAGFRLPAALME